MLYALTPMSLILFLNSIFLIFLGAYLWRSGSYRFFSMVMFASSFWAFCSSMESGSVIMPDKILWAKITYIGIFTVTSSWFLFSIQYAQAKKSLIRKITYFIWLIPAALIILNFTNESHHLFWTNIIPVGGDVNNGLIYDRGFGVYASMAYSYSLLLSGIVVLAIYAFKTTKIQRSQIFTLFLGLLFPWFANFIYLAYSPETSKGVDLTPMTFAITGVFAALSIFKYKLSTIIPAAKDLVYSNLEVGVIVINNENIVADFNPMAKQILDGNLVNGMLADNILLTPDLTLKAIINEEKDTTINLPEISRWLDIHTNNLNDRMGIRIGKAILFYNITAQKDIEQKLKESNRFFSDLTDFLPDPMFVIDTDKKIVFWNKAMEKLTGTKSEDMIGKGDDSYSIPFYGKKRPMLVDLLLNNDPKSELWELYKDEKIERIGSLITTKVFNKFLKKEGIYLWALAQPIFDDKGKVIYAVESIRDVDDLHKYQEELQAKIDELSAMNKVMVNRELKMIKLKEELNLLKAKINGK